MCFLWSTSPNPTHWVPGDLVNAWLATEVLYTAAKVQALVVPLSDAQGIPSGTKEGPVTPGDGAIPGNVAGKKTLE